MAPFHIALLLSISYHANALQSHIFKTLQSQEVHVDKSLLIKLLFDRASQSSNSSPPYFYITAPRRFGKSINTDMIYTFASMQYDLKGDPLPPETTISYDIFRKLQISNYPQLVFDHLARHVVLQFDLLGIAIAPNTVEQAIKDITTLLNYEVQSYPKITQLLTSSNPIPNEYNINERELNFLRSIERKNISQYDGEESILLMVKILSQIYKTKVILLVHQHDETALNSYLLQKSYVGPVYKFLNTLLVKVLTFGKPYLEFVVMHAASTIAYVMDYTLKNLVRHYAFMDEHDFTPYYGISAAEAEDLMERFRCNDTEKETLRKYYGGYRTAISGNVFFTSYSISTYFYHKTRSKAAQNPPPSYLHKSLTLGRVSLFMKDPTFRKHILDMFENGTFEYAVRKINEPETLHQMERLRDRRFEGVLPHHVPMLFTQCFELGYFTHAPEGNHTYCIPNEETREMYKEELNTYYKVYKRN